MRYLFILLVLLSASCSSTLPSFKPYHLDVQQGNVINAKMMLQLKPGMSKSQVRYVLGTPLLQDSFHQDRWDYYYQMAKGGEIVERRRVILEFQADGLKTVRGDVIPAGAAGAEGAALASVTDLKTVKSDKTLLAEDPKSSWSDRFKFWKDKDQDGKVLDKPEAKSEAAADEAKKGWIDKLKFWADDAKPEAPKAAAMAKPEAVKPEPAKVEVLKAPEPEMTKAEPVPAPAVLEMQKPEAIEMAKDALRPEADVAKEQATADEAVDANQEAIAKMIAAWANAWRTKNVNAYLAFYSANFKPEGMSKAAWVAQRKQRIAAKSGAVSLELEKVTINTHQKNARVSFIQHYTSGKFSDVVTKVLALENASGNWLILKEAVTNNLLQPDAEQMPPVVVNEKSRDVTADEKSEAMPEKMMQESAKQAQQPAPVAPVAEPVKPIVEAKPTPVVPAKVETPKAPVSKKEMPLPPEGDPGYFERMLEKIGF